MRVYSFNKTIYRGCVEREFYFFCLWRDLRLLRYLPGQIWAFLRYCLGVVSRTGVWEAFHRYFQGLESFERRMEVFWSERRLHRLKKSFLIQRRPQDIIVSGAPECLLEPVRRHLGMRCLLASIVDPKTGHYMGLSCHGAEQLRRLQQSFPGEPIEEFWSARLDEAPIAEKAAVRRIVRRGQLLDWDAYRQQSAKWRGFLRTWISPQFFRFWCVGCVNMAVTWSLEAICALFLPVNPAFAVGYVAGLCVSFVLNSKLTFHAPLTFYRLGRFFLSYVPNFLVQMLSVLLFFNLLGWPHLLAYWLAAIVGTPVTFLCLKYFAFRGIAKSEPNTAR